MYRRIRKYKYNSWHYRDEVSVRKALALAVEHGLNVMRCIQALKRALLNLASAIVYDHDFDTMPQIPSRNLCEHIVFDSFSEFEDLPPDNFQGTPRQYLGYNLDQCTLANPQIQNEKLEKDTSYVEWRVNNTFEHVFKVCKDPTKEQFEAACYRCAFQGLSLIHI